MLSVRIKKVSPTHHEFAYRRADGTGETLELETKSFLFHDLLHFAVESEARLQNSFYGLLAKNKSYAALSEPEDRVDFSNEVVMTERVVGALTGVVKNGVAFSELYAVMQNMLDAYNEPMPEWLTEGFVSGVQERMRQLLGRWDSTKFGEYMELQFDTA